MNIAPLAAPTQPLAVSAKPSHRATLLVVDDNPDTADSVAALLEAADFAVIAAYSAQDGLDRLDERQEIGLVISDIRMPGLDGFDFLRVVKHRFPALPIVLTTGLPITDDDAVPHGALILQKPFAIGDLTRAIAEQLQTTANRRSKPQ